MNHASNAPRMQGCNQQGCGALPSFCRLVPSFKVPCWTGCHFEQCIVPMSSKDEEDAVIGVYTWFQGEPLVSRLEATPD